jgi:hypothetical protein
MGKRSRRRGDAPEPDGAVKTEAQADEVKAGAEPTNGHGAPDEPGGPPAPSGGPPKGDLRLREALDFVEEADMLLALFRWTALTGEIPKPDDWMPREDWPHPDAVSNVFGSWTRFLEYSGLRDAPPVLRKRALDERESRLEGRARQLEREEKRAADLRRQLDVARRRRAEAEALRDERERGTAGLEQRIAAAERRAEDAEKRLADQRAALEQVTATPGDAMTEDWLRAHEAALAELEQVRQHRDELLERTEALEGELARQRTSIGELSALLGSGPEGEDGAATAAPDGDEEPESVLEAVRIARETLPHLAFTEAADESAADSPFRRPGEILDTLRKLDRLAELYADPGGFGRSLAQAAQEQGLTWRQGVSELARHRFPNDYVITHDGAKLELGPHVAIGSGSGAGFVARIYLHVADGSGGVPRGIYVGHVGRHLPDTTT